MLKLYKASSLVAFRRLLPLTLMVAICSLASAQQLKIRDFAVWGGSASATAFNKDQGVFIKAKTNITGNVGSNHMIDAKFDLDLDGSMYSGNGISLGAATTVNGSLFANKLSAAFKGDVITSNLRSIISGDITSNGPVDIANVRLLPSKVTGMVKVPAPTNKNYDGPVPGKGYSNSFTLPIMPVMPVNTDFDSKLSTVDVVVPKVLTPGVYRNLNLKGRASLTFSGPGNYIFYSVKNTGSSNEIVFDFKNTTAGTINIYVISTADFGDVTTKMINGNAPDRIYTEVHSVGAKKNEDAFTISGPNSSWLGAVWAPFGDIHIQGVKNTITGALWSGTSVAIDFATTIIYKQLKVEPNFISPYYPPPPGGKVTTANNIIGAELTSLNQNTGAIQSIPDNDIFRIKGGSVLIEVISKAPNDGVLLNQLITAGMTGVINNGPHIYMITGYFPITKLPTLNSNTRIQFVRPAYPPLNNAGAVVTQGDVTMRSDKTRDRFGLDGAGVKVGVLSDSYNSKNAAQSDINDGELPGAKTNGQPNDYPDPVQVLMDLPTPGNDEGRAMLQIVHDIAPKAKLAYRTGFLTAGDFASGIRDLSNPALSGGRCDVLVDDITYITEPFLRDGVVAKMVDSVAAAGVTYFSAAGNFGDRSYENTFQGVANTSILPAPATLHRFGATNAETFQTLKLAPGEYTIVLQWSDDFHSLGSVQGVQTDLDLYLLNSTGFTLFGFNRSNLFGDPFEVCPFTVTEETEAKLMVVNATGSNANVRFKYIIFRGDAKIMDYPSPSPSTIVGHPNAAGCITVGAMLYANIPQYTPVYPSVASFSSRGGTSTLNSDGTTYSQRLKPDLIAPNGVNTTVALKSPDFSDGDPYPNFFGTSAAAPHAAGVAALLIQAKKKFDLQTTVTPAEVKALLFNSAGKFPGSPGAHNFTSGYGFLQADSAVSAIANGRPVITSWQPAGTDLIPNGSTPFPIKIKGAYLAPNSQIYFNGIPVTVTSVSADKTEATGSIPAFSTTTDPAIQLYNPPKTPSLLDGGLSEALHFFSTKKDVTVKVVNASRKYGQVNPAFSVEVFIDGLPINQTGITLADLKLDGNNLTIFTNAVATSPSGVYGIFASRTTPVNTGNATDAAILSKYGFTFVSGALSVNKINLKITPNNKQIKYGDYVGEITYNYELENNPGGIPNLLDQVKTLHKKYIADNALVVVKDFTQQSTFTTTDLANMSAMASFQALRNARKFSITSGQLQPLVNELNNSQFADQRFLVDVSAQSLVNYKNNSAVANLVAAFGGDDNQRAILSVKALADGSAKSSLNGQLQPIVNGQLMAMINGQLQALVNGQLRALVNGTQVLADDYVFENGQLMALVNGTWTAITSGQLQAIVNGLNITVDISVTNGQLQAIVNGQLMASVNGQLQAIVNGQLLAMVNGQLQALVNGQLMPIVNGQLMALVNGQLQPMVNGQLMALVNGQLMALVNGQLMALVNGQLENLTNLTLSNGQLRALVNGQLMPLVNGQLKALVNGVVTDVPTTNVALVNGQLQAIVNGQLQALVSGQLRAIVNGQLQPIVNELEKVADVQKFSNGQLRAIVNGQLLPIVNGQLRAMVNGSVVAIPNESLSLVNGQLQALVNGQLQALVNGQLRALVNGQLQALVNGDLEPVQKVERLSNGQLRAIVNTTSIPIGNGQLQAIVNGQLLAMVNGQLMALVNGELTFAVISNGQLQALVNGQLQAIVNQGGSIANGQLLALVNGQLQPLVNATFTNGQLQALVNNQPLSLANGQLLALVNGQLQPLVNNFNVSGATNNTNTITVIDGDDITLQGGALGGMFAVNMITGLDVGTQTLVPGAFVDDNFNVTYGLGQVQITPRPLLITADNKSKILGSDNPPLTMTASGFAFGETIGNITQPGIVTAVNNNTAVGNYPITLSGGSAQNYSLILGNGNFEVTNQILVIRPRNQASVYGDEFPVLTYDVEGLLPGDFLTLEPTIYTSAIPGSNAGVYPIFASRATTNRPYEIRYDTGQLCISQKRLVITAEDKAKTVGTSNPTLTLNYNGLVAADNESSVCAAYNPQPVNSYVTPPATKIINQFARTSTYTNVQLNGRSNVFFADPGQSITLTGNRSTVYYDPQDVCTGCVTQLYIGMRDNNCGNTFSDCNDVSGLVNQNVQLNRTFNAPTAPGVYYITQVSSWEYNCYDRGSGFGRQRS